MHESETKGKERRNEGAAKGRNSNLTSHYERRVKGVEKTLVILARAFS
jgi:hypothetical protein